ncbi:MAG: hypothetical protein A2X12_02835 [Bacteroidetes bacterium GWE2_29_8]|nr:MAG: hypothetical protein A2X12_02835 [Bacteroidetes bacterium GWE2_29_8]OFY24864.1 MAG: hypothetical protein A2X02_03975 [Bacteroidetes bacterium GWF2_29_10]
MEINKKVKIFIIEDNRTENMLLKLAISSINNIEIKGFALGADLLNDLDKKPDIVIADLNLPDISGFDLIKTIKAYDEQIKIVVVSAQRDIDIIMKVQAMNVCNYIVKSESCLQYLSRVIEDIIIVESYRHKYKDDFINDI